MTQDYRHLALVAAFADEESFEDAVCEALVSKRWRVETFTPRPIEPVEKLLEPERSRLPRLIFLAFLAGAAGGFFLQVYPSVFSYPHNVGGRPEFSWPAFIPITFELGVLTASITGFVAFVRGRRWPRFFLRELNCELIRRASEDAYVVVLTAPSGDRRAEDFHRAERHLHALGAHSTERCAW